MEKQKILIVDDSDMNRMLLMDILGQQYDVREAENGLQAVDILSENEDDFWFVLLDIMMPESDGFEVLDEINKRYWNDRVIVIIISSDNSPSNINKAYSRGAFDYISRPFDPMIIRKRIANTLFMHARQRDLEKAIQKEYYEHQKNNELMLSILSHIVEFRNGESGPHIQNVKTITELLLKRLVQITDKYPLSPNDISLITMVSAMHDIGKISIPEDILNKPGKLTAEEFEIIKTHSEIGAKTLSLLTAEQFHSPLVKFAYEVCRWHHERYDGRGYPDGLKGDAIPISAQVVSIADVYDALACERCYKAAYSHEEALAMILNGECGVFNPILLQCLTDISDRLKQVYVKVSGTDDLTDTVTTHNFRLEAASADQPEYLQQLYVDPLTKAYNRRYFEESVRDFSAIKAILIIDLDDFERINEVHGQEAGNLALYHTAQTLLSLCRRNDYLIRYGNETFLIVFNEISKHSFRTKVEEFLTCLESMVISEYPQIHLTARVGGVYGGEDTGKISHTLNDILSSLKTTEDQMTIRFLDETEDGVGISE